MSAQMPPHPPSMQGLGFDHDLGPLGEIIRAQRWVLPSCRDLAGRHFSFSIALARCPVPRMPSIRWPQPTLQGLSQSVGLNHAQQRPTIIILLSGAFGFSQVTFAQFKRKLDSSHWTVCPVRTQSPVNQPVIQKPEKSSLEQLREITRKPFLLLLTSEYHTGFWL